MRAITILLLLVPILFVGCGSSGGDNSADPKVTVQGQEEIPVGASVQFMAMTIDGTDSGYTWTSSDG